MSELINDQFICFACRNTGCDSYTIYRGYLICEYCLDDWLKAYENSDKILEFEYWCANHKIFLEKQNASSTQSEHKIQCDDCKRTYDFMEVDRCLDGNWRCKQCIAERKQITLDSIKDGEDSKANTSNSFKRISTDPNAPINIHSQNKEFLDKDYAKTNSVDKNIKIGCGRNVRGGWKCGEEILNGKPALCYRCRKTNKEVKE